MENLPVLRIELEGIRQNVAHMFDQNHEILRDMISATLEKTLTKEWVQQQITYAVEDCVSKSIKSLSDNYVLQKTITDMMAEQIDTLISKKEEVK